VHLTQLRRTVRHSHVGLHLRSSHGSFTAEVDSFATCHRVRRAAKPMVCTLAAAAPDPRALMR
jgi:hypothetical protein